MKLPSHINLTAGTLLLAVLLAGCDRTPDWSELENTSWELVEMTVLGGFEFAPDDPGKYTLSFRPDNRLTGQSDCNTFTGVWNTTPNFSFTDVESTRSMCLSGSLHNFYVLYLSDVVAAEEQDDTLILRTTDAEVRLGFRKAG